MREWRKFRILVMVMRHQHLIRELPYLSVEQHVQVDPGVAAPTGQYGNCSKRVGSNSRINPELASLIQHETFILNLTISNGKLRGWSCVCACACVRAFHTGLPLLPGNSTRDTSIMKPLPNDNVWRLSAEEDTCM